MVPALPVYLVAQCFLGCGMHILLCDSFCKLLLSPLQAYLLHHCLSLDLAAARELVGHFHHLLELSKAWYQDLQFPSDGLGWLPSHQGLTAIAPLVIVHVWALWPAQHLGIVP